MQIECSFMPWRRHPVARPRVRRPPLGDSWCSLFWPRRCSDSAGVSALLAWATSGLPSDDVGELIMMMIGPAVSIVDRGSGLRMTPGIECSSAG